MSYDIYCGTTRVGSTTSTTFKVDDLTPGTAYSFTVKANDAGGNFSNPSNTIQVSTLSYSSYELEVNLNNFPFNEGNFNVRTFSNGNTYIHFYDTAYDVSEMVEEVEYIEDNGEYWVSINKLSSFINVTNQNGRIVLSKNLDHTSLTTLEFAAKTQPNSMSDLNLEQPVYTSEDMQYVIVQLETFIQNNPDVTIKQILDYSREVANSLPIVKDEEQIHFGTQGYDSGTLNPEEERLWNSGTTYEERNRAFYNGIASGITAILAVDASEELFNSYVLSNGNGDAYRHAYWGALMVLFTDYQWAGLWGDAHENGDPNNPANQKEMDLFNNRTGRMIAFKYLSQLNSPIDKSSSEELSRRSTEIEGLILSSLNHGELKRIDSSGRVIPTDSTGKNTVDWYHLQTKDPSGNTYDIYLSDVAGTVGETDKVVEARVSKNGFRNYIEYKRIGVLWSETGRMYARAPGQIEPGTVTTASLKLPKIRDVVYDFSEKIEAIENLLYEYLDINPFDLSEDDKNKIYLGFANNFDDNVAFGFIKKITQTVEPDDNYHYLRSKAFADACFVMGYTMAEYGSAAAAAQAFVDSGSMATLALATSPTGVGGISIGAAAIEELARGAALSGISFLSSKMAKRARENVEESTTKLQNSVGYKIRNVGDNVLDRFEGYPNLKNGGHTIREHVSKPTEELNRRAIQKEEDATSYENKSTAIQAVKRNLRKNATKIEEWLDGPTERRAFDVEHDYFIGYGAEGTSGTMYYNLKKSRIVLVKDSSIPEGFYILTSFPIF